LARRGKNGTKEDTKSGKGKECMTQPKATFSLTQGEKRGSGALQKRGGGSTLHYISRIVWTSKANRKGEGKVAPR